MLSNERCIGRKEGNLKWSKVFLHSHSLSYVEENDRHRGVPGKNTTPLKGL